MTTPALAQLAGLSASLAVAVQQARHPAAAIGGLIAFGSSLAVQSYLGSALQSEDLVVPDWNV